MGQNQSYAQTRLALKVYEIALSPYFHCQIGTAPRVSQVYYQHKLPLVAVLMDRVGVWVLLSLKVIQAVKHPAVKSLVGKCGKVKTMFAFICYNTVTDAEAESSKRQIQRKHCLI